MADNAGRGNGKVIQFPSKRPGYRSRLRRLERGGFRAAKLLSFRDALEFSLRLERLKKLYESKDSEEDLWK